MTINPKKINILFFTIFITFGFLAFTSQASAAWYDLNWLYRKKVTITGQAGAGTNYQVKLRVGQSSGSSNYDFHLENHSKTDFGDLRFTASDQTTLLSYWVESVSGTTPNQTAIVWVKVADDLGTNKDIYAYYGNSSATTIANGVNTFLFFDDFSGDLSKWTIDSENTDVISISAGALRQNPDSTQTKNIYSDSRLRTTSFQMSDGAVGYKTYLAGATNRKIHQFGWRVDGLSFGSGYAWRMQNSSADGGFFELAANAWTPNGASYGAVSTDTWYNVETRSIGQNMEGFVNGTSIGTLTDNTAAGLGYLTSHLHGISLDAGDYTLVDDVRVRKIVSTEPAYASVTIEEISNVKQVYYSVGQSVSDLKTGTPSVTIANGAATFTVAQTGNIGVGDRVTYNTSQIAYISAKTNADGMHWSLVTATGGLPADISNSAVVSITREFTSLSSAEAAASNATHINNTDLVAANVVLNLPCYYDTGADTTAVTIDGYTTGANNYIKVYTPNNIATEANFSQRHQGNVSSGYRLSNTASYQHGIRVEEDYVTVDGIAVSVNVVNGNNNAIILHGDGVGIISNNIVYNSISTNNIANGIVKSNSSAGDTYIYNNIVYGIQGVGITSGYFGTTYNTFIYNNTVYANGSGIQESGNVNFIAKNNISLGNTGGDYLGTVDSSTNNISGDATSPNSGATDCGGHSCRNQTVSFVDATNKDFHLLPTDTAAKNSGADLSADANLPVTTDIDGASRNASINAWDIGADETATQIFRSVGPSATAILESDTSHARTVTLVSGIATFSNALADNIGVGDAVLIDTNSDNSITSADTLLFIHSRTSSTVYTLRTHTGATPSDITVNDTYQIYRAYTSLANAESGTKNTSIPITFNGGNRDLVANNEQWNIACYANGTTADTTNVVVDGWNTSNQNNLKIYTPTISSEVGISQRHSGKWDDGKYRLEASVQWLPMISVARGFIKLDGLQVYNTATANQPSGVRIVDIRGITGEFQISNNIVRLSSSYSNNNQLGITADSYSIDNDNTKYKIYNNIVLDAFMGINFAPWGGSSNKKSYVFNNTVINAKNTGMRFYYGTYTGSAGELYLKNNLVQGSNTNYAFYDTGSLSVYQHSNNISQDTTSSDGASYQNKIVSFVDATNKDFHLLPTDTAAKNSGADLSADTNLPFNTDIDGASRNASINAWDIGADETATQIFRSVGPSATAILESDTSHARTVTLVSGIATFSNALADNIGVGDAVLIDTNSDNSITSADTLLFIHSRTSSTVYTLRTHTGATPSDITVNDTYQIYRAYTSLANAESGTKNTSIPITFNGGNRDLVANNEQWNIACYANGVTADTTAVTIDGWNTGSQNFIKVYTPVYTNEVGVSQRHNGKWDISKYRLEYTGNDTALRSSDEYTLIEGLQIKRITSGSYGNTIGIYTSATAQKINGNIIDVVDNYTNSTKAIHNAGSTGYILNNIMYGTNLDYGYYQAESYGYVYNNTVIGAMVAGYNSTWQLRMFVNNNIAQSCADGFSASSNTFGFGSNYNISDLAADAPGANSKNSTDVQFANEAGNDFHLSQSDTAARGAGANLTTEVTSYGLLATDVDGQLRNSSGAGWDIGADEGTVEFTPTVMQSGGDYSTLSSWEAGVQTDLVASTTRVFSHSGITGTIADNASVTGLTSNATATVVHATTNQILLETISGTFVSGEIIQVTAGNSVVISDNGNPASAVAKIDGAWTVADTTAVSIDGWNSGADNYIKVYTTPTARHLGKWDDGKYRLQISSQWSPSLYLFEDFLIIDGVQIAQLYDGSSGAGEPYLIRGSGAVGAINKYNSKHQISNNIIKAHNSYSTSSQMVQVINAAEVSIFNNIIIDAYYGINSAIWSQIPLSKRYIYNNTIINPKYVGIQADYGGTVTGLLYLKNNIIQGSNTNYSINSTSYLYDYQSSNNISSDATAPGTNSKINATVNFVSTASGSEDFHLLPTDTAAKNAGADLSADANLPVTTDIDGQTRNASINAFDIGADESATQIYRSVGPSATAILESDTSHARTVTLVSGIATFSNALADNIGVGDAVLIDTNSDNSITSADTLLFIHSRTSSTVYTLRTHTGATPSDITVNDTYQIYRAYTSLANAESGTKNTSIPITFNGGNRDLVANNEQWNIACYANGTTADTTSVSINGWVTGAQNFIKIYTPVNISEVGVSQRHSGKLDSNKYLLSAINLAYPYNNIVNNVAYLKIDGLQMFYGHDTQSAIYGINTNGLIPVDLTISNNIIKGDLTKLYTNDAIYFGNSNSMNFVSKIYNNVIYDTKNNGINDDSYKVGGVSGIDNVYNNTIYNCLGVGIRVRNGNNRPMLIKNNIVQNCTDGYSGTFDASSNYNISNLAADAPGANSKNSTSVSFVDATNKDFHLSSTDTAAKKAGVNLQNDLYLRFSDDIDGQERAGNWDIGADEFRETQISAPTGVQKLASPESSRGNTDGLVGYWSFDGPTISGTTVNDLSGLGNHGTNSGATPTAGKIGQGMDFNGTSNYINIPDPDLVEGLSQITVSAWVQSNRLVTVDDRGIIAQYFGSGGDSFILQFRNSDEIGFGVNTGVYVGALANSALADTDWHNYVGVYNGANVLLYIDSVLQNDQPAQTGNIISSTNPLTIGEYDSDRNWDGAIDEVRIYNRALSADEIVELYNTGRVEVRE